ncbi:p-type copper atpase [Chlorella sorokiniana]|uniref:P-type copper atpase n=1 Tax=Chlorella sorokiniana TaxID=3076 RepID=A0A2P6TYF4_CHLSO|nr:p-type copper atpase [Chlorella sorokiniana]|eukprot:PRW59099.1 p-type copper atpase [Chlorella sorokiniana]
MGQLVCGPLPLRRSAGRLLRPGSSSASRAASAQLPHSPRPSRPIMRTQACQTELECCIKSFIEAADSVGLDGKGLATMLFGGVALQLAAGSHAWLSEGIVSLLSWTASLFCQLAERLLAALLTQEEEQQPEAADADLAALEKIDETAAALESQPAEQEKETTE